RDELRQRLLSSGLDEGWLPNEIRAADAFRRSTKEAERKIPSQANVFQNYICREVYSDTRIVQRNIVLETVDQKGKRLDYEGQAAIITLDKENNTIHIQGNDPVALELAKAAEKTFHIDKENYSAQSLRVMAMNILKSMSPTPVRPNGGVYFVPSAHSEQLEKWVNLLKSLDKGEAF